jgi:hypothetical protein
MNSKLRFGVNVPSESIVSSYDGEVLARRVSNSVIDRLACLPEVEKFKRYKLETLEIPCQIKLTSCGSLCVGSRAVFRCVQIFSSVDSLSPLNYFAYCMNLLYSFLICKLVSVGDFESVFYVVVKGHSEQGIETVLTIIESAVLEICSDLGSTSQRVFSPPVWFNVLSKIDL